MTESIFIVGDVHGKFKQLLNKLPTQNNSPVEIICVGDLGIGFHPSQEMEQSQLKVLNGLFKARNITFYSIRGNHDDPDYFRGSTRVELSNLVLLDDYTTLEFGGKKLLLVGGAVSIDRLVRIENIDYWKDEGFILDESKISECDILITHSAPAWIGPCSENDIKYWTSRDPTLWEECVAERRAHNKLTRLAKPSRLYAGHFHGFYNVEHEGCNARILDELEIVECRLNL